MWEKQVTKNQFNLVNICIIKRRFDKKKKPKIQQKQRARPIAYTFAIKYFIIHLYLFPLKEKKNIGVF